MKFKEEKSTSEWVQMLEAHHSVEHLPGKNFALKISKNIVALEEALKDLHEALTPTEEFKEFVNTHISPIQGDSEKIAEVEKAHPEIVEARAAQIETGKRMMEEIRVIELDTIPQNMLPQHISAAQIKALKELIK
jgi:hypothetical protein